MIVLCGFGQQHALTDVAACMTERGLDHHLLLQEEFDNVSVEIRASRGKISGILRLESGQEIDMESVDAWFPRLYDPWLMSALTGKRSSASADRVYRALYWWLEATPSRVVNRPSSLLSNWSKPMQARLIRDFGFRTPKTLVTNDPGLAAQFVDSHDRVICKGVSAAPTRTTMVDDAARSRIDRVRNGPTLFQEFIEGLNIRVHVVDGEVIAVAMRSRSNAVDYRHSGDVERYSVELDDVLSQRCARLVRGLGLVLAGVDLIVRSTGEVYCLEVNTLPGFPYFDDGHRRVANAVVDWLVRRET